jgi:hypothetical protein
MHLPALQSPSPLVTAAALPHVRGLSRLGVLRRLRPARTDRLSVRPAPPTRRLRTARARSGTVPVFTVVRSTEEEPDYAPCGIAASTPQPFLAARAHRRGSPPPAQTHGRCAPLPAQIRQVRAGAASRGCHTPVPLVLLSVPLAGPKPSGSAGQSRRCQGCSHPPRHHPAQAALSSTALLRQDQRRRSLTSPRTTAPHGARTSCDTPQPASPSPAARTSKSCSRCSAIRALR